jgi:hypothetical protein
LAALIKVAGKPRRKIEMNTLIELLDNFAGADGRVDRLETYNAVHKGIEELQAELARTKELWEADQIESSEQRTEIFKLRAELDKLKVQEPVEQDQERERAAFEADAEPLGFDLLRMANPNVEPWDDYHEMETGMRWGGWLARAAITAPQAPAPERNYLQDIAACIGVGGYNGANDQQLYERICDEFARMAAPQAPAPNIVKPEPLTDAQVDRISKSYGRRHDFARAIQAARDEQWAAPQAPTGEQKCPKY